MTVARVVLNTRTQWQTRPEDSAHRSYVQGKGTWSVTSQQLKKIISGGGNSYEKPNFRWDGQEDPTKR